MDAVKAIKNRRTQKVLADNVWEVSTNQKELKNTVDELLDLASCAPYHYKSDLKHQSEEKELNSCLPFRFYVLDTSHCRELINYAKEQGIELKKLKNMLSASDVLFIVTWLPKQENTSVDNKKEPFPFYGDVVHMEHIAAASAAIQNVLIGATAKEIPNYWSSGGPLREKELREYLEIPLNEILLGAIFLFPKDINDKDVFIKTGGLRESGKEKKTWSKWITKK
ncbi:nitroreductase family protein [Ochrovirga pacifica]|uniref:nitroreductase family protein n=1 Tax=Ochrovirga pacifica TaxID=1042376 RepID=UPI000255A051|nr:nitroreductase family protein [Ochrovirga pacifica]